MSVLGIVFFNGEEGGNVVIKQDGEIIYSGSLAKDHELHITGDYSNTIRIEGGEVRFVVTNCPNEDCVHSGAISRTGQMIACLPNRVTVSIEGESEVDSIAR